MILCAQLLITAVLVVASVSSASYRNFIATHTFLYIVALVASIICMYALACYQELARTVPINYILLAVFTVCEAYAVSAMTSMFTTEGVINAAILTASIVIGLTVYAFTTKTDFTYAGGLLFMVSSGFIFMMLLGMFFNSNMFNLIMSFIGACLFGLYLIYDTQLIIGGEGRAAQYSIDDYIMAALNIYIDIIQIFIEILRLIAEKRD